MTGELIEVIGCGEAFGVGLGNTSYAILRPAGRAKLRRGLLIDCGYQIPERVWERNFSPDAVALTHLHADHAFGLVPLLVREWEDGRKRPLEILGPRGTARWLERALDLGYPGIRTRFGFELTLTELADDREARWERWRIRSARTAHSVLTHTLRFDREGCVSFAVSGDGAITPAAARLVRAEGGVGLLFQEVFTAAPGPASAVHADWKSVARLYCGSDPGIPGRVVVAHVSRRARSAVGAAVRVCVRAEMAVPGKRYPLKRGKKK